MSTAHLGGLPAAERGPALVPLGTLTDTVVDLIEDETLAGRVVLLGRSEESLVLN